MPARHIALLIGLVLVIQAVAPSAVAAAGTQSGQAVPQNTGGFVLADAQRDATGEHSDLRYPNAPGDDRRPRFVRQTGKNCAFASAAMLIDKWTGGDSRPSQLRLRLASRVPSTQGVSLGELARAVGRVTKLDLRYSPGGGDPLTWDALLSRLARGGGAVVGGAYSRLPRHYQRWARDFARQGVSGSGHAVYVERYQPGRGGGRLWLMDPLASGAGYSGEWISARALRRFAWHNSRGLVSAAATPEPPRLAGYQFGPPEVADWPVAGQPLNLRLPVTIKPGWPKPPELSLSASWVLIEAEPDRLALLPDLQGTTARAPEDTPPEAVEQDLGPDVLGRLPAVDGQAVGTSGELASPEPEATDDDAGRSRRPIEVTLRDGHLTATLPAPAEPGLHRLILELRRADGRALAKGEAPQLSDVLVQVRGPLAAEFDLVSVPELEQGARGRVQLSVVNRGSLDWLADEALTVTASWDTWIGTLAGGSATVELAAGAQGTFTVNTRVPAKVSEGTLRLELFDADGVPLAAYGAEPLLVWLRFKSEAAQEPPSLLR